jgi:hypothetical protein
LCKASEALSAPMIARSDRPQCQIKWHGRAAKDLIASPLADNHIAILSTPWTWNTDFTILRPIVLTIARDGMWFYTQWHFDAARMGRGPQASKAAANPRTYPLFAEIDIG